MYQEKPDTAEAEPPSSTVSDDARAALETMRLRRIRRLPVVDQSGRLTGILSLHDIAAQARSSKGADVPTDAVLDTYLAITAAAGLPVHA